MGLLKAMASLEIHDLPKDLHGSPNKPTSYDSLKKSFGKKTVVARSFQLNYMVLYLEMVRLLCMVTIIII